MAAPTGQLRARRYFGALVALIAVIYLLVFLTSGSTAPKLGLDLQGGTRVTLSAKTEDGGAPTAASLNIAREIIERRVNGSGVAEAEVVTEGGDRIVISVPGHNDDQVKRLGSTAKLRFRPVYFGPVGAQQQIPDAPASDTPASDAPASDAPASDAPASDAPASDAPASDAPAGDSASSDPSAQPRPLALAADETTAPASDAPASDAPASDPSGAASSAPATDPSTGTTAPTDPTQTSGIPTTPPEGVSQAAYQKAVDAFQNLDCSTDDTGGSADRAEDPIAACSQDGQSKYLLAPAIIDGTEVKDASSGFDSQTGQGWIVQLDLKSTGQSIWANYTSQHNAVVSPGSVANLVAFTLDGQVVSAPEIQGTINGQTQVTGQFTQQSSEDLANSLKYGALPLTFTQSEASTVSPTLGTDQLKAGLLAGGIGLALVAIYTLLYYRALGLVTIASLLISGALTYGSLVLLGRYMGFTLTLAGIAGFIVAVGITADSFIVFFERLKDEVREGKSMRSAVPRAWVRARRTILSADAVSFLAAAILYYLAASEVRGFAFTLGLSTILDLIVVFVFTHPLVAVASRSKSFSSARFTGLGSLRRPAAAGGSAGASR